MYDCQKKKVLRDRLKKFVIYGANKLGMVFGNMLRRCEGGYISHVLAG